MNKAEQERNLDSLLDEYRYRGRALTGYEELSKALKYPESIPLSIMLRDHRSKPIRLQRQLDFRDGVDFLLKGYSLIELGIICGYLPTTLGKDLETEIRIILGDKIVKRYYENYYPLLLPGMLYNRIVYQTKLPAFNGIREFREVLLMDTMIDETVELFLWMLDDGVKEGHNIKSLISVLNSKKEIENIVKRPMENESVLDKAFWGFTKFTEYLMRYSKLLKNCESTYVKSALWHYQSYWFENIKGKMKNSYLEAVEGIIQSSNNVSFSEFESQQLDRDKANPEKITVRYNDWKKQMEGEKEKIKQAVNYILDSSLGLEISQRNAGTAIKISGANLIKTIDEDLTLKANKGKDKGMELNM